MKKKNHFRDKDSHHFEILLQRYRIIFPIHVKSNSRIKQVMSLHKYSVLFSTCNEKYEKNTVHKLSNEFQTCTMYTM